MCYNLNPTEAMDPAPAPVRRDSAEELYNNYVGDELTEQYYAHLQNSPELLHQFYKDESTITRPGLDGVMRSATLPDMIQDLDMLSSGGFDSVEVTSVISQGSHSRCIFVDVYGYITIRERPPRYFTQILFLAPQENGYFVYNDMFKFLDISEVNATIPSANAAVTEGKAICIKNLPPYTTIASLEEEFTQFGEIRRGGTEIRWKRSFSYGFVEFKEENAAQKAIEASPIMFGGNRVYVERKRPDYMSYWETPSSGPGNIRRSVERRGTEAPGNNGGNEVADESLRVSEPTDGTENQESQELYDSFGIYVKNLPPNATIDWLENVFTRFGLIKEGEVTVYNPGGLENWYGFVTFVEADAAESAIEASPIRIDGRKLLVQKQFNRGVRNRN
ncbi:PREDICTED: putative G3BP-like protein [Camelina sativa]|uniref:G3BP-like protein n=1 Tax=Camelina sativa TaxID=90675 RepID=A0ABM1QZH2_CAMSA|nr:PREDICTED: putative G3BP-like protein [Camelina sativa]